MNRKNAEIWKGDLNNKLQVSEEKLNGNLK
jgi:hypothetical protein